VERRLDAEALDLRADAAGRVATDAP